MCLGVVSYVNTWSADNDMYHMKDITAGNLDSEKELFVSSVLSLAFLGVPVLQCVIKLTFKEEKNWKATRYW